jgi:hypothetical protein
MNIFITSNCPIESAKFLDDKRSNKMLLESAQLLCSAINEHGGKAPYRTTHRNHPSSVWCRATRDNWDWLFQHYVALCDEYTRRSGKVHKSSLMQEELLSQRHFIPEGDLTPFANCARNLSKGVDFTHEKDVTIAYQLYLSERWETDVREPVWS